MKNSRMSFWNVIWHGKVVNRVSFTSDCDAEYVRDRLVKHDGFPFGIRVVKA